MRKTAQKQYLKSALDANGGDSVRPPLYISNGTSAGEPHTLARSPDRRNLSPDACQTTSVLLLLLVPILQLPLPLWPASSQPTTRAFLAEQTEHGPICCGRSGPHHPPRSLHEADEPLLDVQDLDVDVDDATILLFELQRGFDTQARFCCVPLGIEDVKRGTLS